VSEYIGERDDPVRRRQREFVLQRLRGKVETWVSQEILDLPTENMKLFVDDAIDGVKPAILLYLAGTKVQTNTLCPQTVHVPESWWDAIKERFSPTWARHRWPVRYRTIETVTVQEYFHIFPHIRISELGTKGKRYLIFHEDDFEDET